MYLYIEFRTYLNIFLVERLDKVYPKDLKVHQGQTAFVLCYSDRDVAWVFQQKRLPSNVETGTIRKSKNIKWMIIRQVEPYNAGTYSCLGSESDLLFFHDSVQLSVLG